jgi:hypothetical protein
VDLKHHPQEVVVKDKRGSCLGCLLAVIIALLLLPVLAFHFKVAFAMAIIDAIRGALGV